MNTKKITDATEESKFAFKVIGAVLYVFVVSYLVYMLWNKVLVELTNVKEATYWQALGILVLSKILFGFRMFGGKERRRKERKERWKNKWSGMSAEDRSRMKEKWKAHCDRKHAE